MKIQPTQATPETPSGPERRATRRHPCLRECIVRPEGARGVGNWSGMAYNISARGIGVALTYPVQPGTNLLIELLGWNQGQGVRARVVRSILDGFVWFHGCEFINPLNKEQLQGWLT